LTFKLHLQQDNVGAEVYGVILKTVPRAPALGLGLKQRNDLRFVENPPGKDIGFLLFFFAGYRVGSLHLCAGRQMEPAQREDDREHPPQEPRFFDEKDHGVHLRGGISGSFETARKHHQSGIPMQSSLVYHFVYCCNRHCAVKGTAE